LKSLIHLEALRGLAALLVFVSHFSQTTALTKTSYLWSWLDTFGNVGVDIFFVLSGFVITYSLTRNGQKSLSQFLKGRARRLVPVYLLLTVFAALLILAADQFGVASGLPQLDLFHLLASIFFLSQVAGFGFPVVAQGWTLEFEAAFYLAAAGALLGRAFGRNQALGLILALAVLGIFADALFFEFGLGVLAYLIFEALEKKLGRFQNGVAAGFVLIGTLSLTLNLPETMDRRFETWAFGAFCVVLGTALLRARKSKGIFANYVGAISYPFYLFQWLSIPIATRVFAILGVPASEVTLIMTLAATWLGSHVINKFWDAPIKRRLASVGW